MCKTTRSCNNSLRASLRCYICVTLGDAASFHEWEFRTRLRIAGRTADQYIEAMSKVCDGLRGDAFVAAQEVAFDHLCEIVDGIPQGIDTLINHMRGMVFPLTEHESKELFRQCCRPGGPLSRQKGEGMRQYVSRRRRCWTLLTRVDPVIHLSEGHRSDMLLDLSGLTREERVMVQASDATLTELPKLSKSNIHVFTSGRAKDERRAKAKTDSNVLTIQTLVGFAEEAKANTGSGKSGASAHHANLTSVEDYDYCYDEHMDESANAYQAHNDPVDPEAMTKKKHWTTMMTRKTTRFLRMLLWMMLPFLRQLNWMRLLFSPTQGTTILTLK